MSNFAPYIIALEIANEEAHEQIVENWITLALSKPFLVTTTYVFDGHIELIEIDRDLFGRGWQYFKKYQDKSSSLTDCISFIVMEKRRIFTAITLDNHFLQAGFQKLP